MAEESPPKLVGDAPASFETSEPIQLYIPLTLPPLRACFTMLSRVFLAPNSFKDYSTHTDPHSLLPIASSLIGCILALLPLCSAVLGMLFAPSWLRLLGILVLAPSFALLGTYGHERQKWVQVQILSLCIGLQCALMWQWTSFGSQAMVLLCGITAGFGVVIIGHPLPAAASPITTAIGIVLFMTIDAIGGVIWLLSACLAASITFVAIYRTMQSTYVAVATSVSLFVFTGGIRITILLMVQVIAFTLCFLLAKHGVRKGLIDGMPSRMAKLALSIGAVCCIVIGVS